MSESPKPEDPRKHPAVRNYMLVRAVALLLILMDLLARGLGEWGLFPVVIGGLGLAMRWRLAPVMLLLSLSGTLYVHAVRYVPFHRFARGYETMSLQDIILCGAVLAYIAGHYRLQGLLLNIFPADSRLATPKTLDRRKQKDKKRQEDKPAAFTPAAPVLLQRRSPRGVTPRELVLLVVLLPVCAEVAQIVWFVLTADEPALELRRELWHAMLLAWIMGCSAFVVSGLFGYLAWRRLTPEEAALYLQDTVWRETRREQWRLNTWVAWARRVKERKDKA